MHIQVDSRESMIIFCINIPIGRAVNPITNDNWEGTGVTPHIEVPEEQALNVAQYMILKKLVEESADADIMGNRWKSTYG